nr:MAG TPA: hypothetical protein [Caudoviricetes sp.]
MSRCRVFKAYCAWHVYEWGPKRYETFTTWAKAMEYANRKSRLAPDITIEDPSGKFGDLTATNKREYVHLKSSGNTFILANTPASTMAEVEWDSDKHYLVEAEHVYWGKVVMLTPAENTCAIRCALQNDEGISIVVCTSRYLTPTGKRYTLTEVQE